MSDKKTVRGRFAPSPSGRMHLGNLCCALLAWLSVRSKDGIMLLRIEDLDPDRCKREYAEQLCRDLLALGLDWDEGPGMDGGNGPYYQSERRELFEKALMSLKEQRRIYPCFCTRAQLHAASAPHAGETSFRYAGTCSRLTAEEAAQRALLRSPAMRFRVNRGMTEFDDLFLGHQALSADELFGDFLVRRSDGVHAYQLAVTVDDAMMGVTEVVRGRDLLTSTACQLQLFDALGAAPPQYGHIPLLVNPDGRRLSKRERDLDVGALLDRFTPEQLCGKIAHLLKMIPQPESITPKELIPLFKTADFSGEAIVVPDDFANTL